MDKSNKRAFTYVETEEDKIEAKFRAKKVPLDAIDMMCPITRQIFLKPVVANDGFTYEKWAIDKILHGDRTQLSPITRKPISSYVENKFVENIVKETLRKNPDYKKIQFNEDIYYDYCENREAARKLLQDKNYEEFSKYKNIHITDTISSREYIISRLFDSYYGPNDDQIIIKILDNCVDLNVNENVAPMGYIALYGSKKVIMHAIKLKGDFYGIDFSNNNSLIHIISQRSNLSNINKIQIIMYVLNNFIINFSYKNKTGITILQCLLNEFNFSEDIINGIIDKIDQDSVYILDPSFLGDICLYCKGDIMTLFFNKLEELIKTDTFIKNTITHFSNVKQFQRWSCKLASFISDINDNDHLSNVEKKTLVEKLYDILINQLNIFDIEKQIYDQKQINSRQSLDNYLKFFNDNINKKIESTDNQSINLEDQDEVEFLLANIE